MCVCIYMQLLLIVVSINYKSIGIGLSWVGSPILQVLQNTIFDVDLDRILQSIHVYLQELGMDEIRRRYD